MPLLEPILSSLDGGPQPVCQALLPASCFFGQCFVRATGNKIELRQKQISGQGIVVTDVAIDLGEDLGSA